MSPEATRHDLRSQRERMLAGDLYLAGDPELAEERRRATRLMEEFNRSVGDLSLIHI